MMMDLKWQSTSDRARIWEFPRSSILWRVPSLILHDRCDASREQHVCRSGDGGEKLHGECRATDRADDYVWRDSSADIWHFADTDSNCELGADGELHIDRRKRMHNHWRCDSCAECRRYPVALSGVQFNER